MIGISSDAMRFERVFDFGDDKEKIFPRRESTDSVASGMSPREPCNCKLSESLQDSLEGSESGYNSVDSLCRDLDRTLCPSTSSTRCRTTSQDSLSMTEEEGEEEMGRHMILAGRNLVCISSPTRDVSSVKHLDLSYNNLGTMNGIHVYSGVEELVLDNNGLRELSLPPMKNLKSLSVNNNEIEYLERTVRNLKIAAPQLTYLSLLCNPLCPNELTSGDEDDYQLYRYTVISHLKNLKFLDSRPITPHERAESERFNSVNVVVRPTDANFRMSDYKIYRGTPLKDSSRPLKPDEKRTSVAGKVRSRYLGKNSEGNRFIGNDCL